MTTCNLGILNEACEIKEVIEPFELESHMLKASEVGYNFFLNATILKDSIYLDSSNEYAGTSSPAFQKYLAPGWASGSLF
jgi:hypothetical protein